MPKLELVKQEPLEISQGMLEKLNEIDNSEKAHHKEWTTEEDKILTDYWQIKNQVQLAKLLGVSANTARARFRKLTQSL